MVLLEGFAWLWRPPGVKYGHRRIKRTPLQSLSMFVGWFVEPLSNTPMRCCLVPKCGCLPGSLWASERMAVVARAIVLGLVGLADSPNCIEISDLGP